MKMNRIFAALCAIVALGVSCQKEFVLENDTDEIIVPEGMKYVSFEVGTPTKITGNPVKWASSKESVAVLAIYNGESKTYEFETAPVGSTPATTSIGGLVDNGAELKYVLYPYSDSDCLDLENDKSGNTISLHKFSAFSYLQANSVASTTPFACKIENNDGVYSASSELKPLYSFIKVTVPSRATDILPEYIGVDKKAAKATSYVKMIKIEGTGVAGATSIDFSGEEPVVTLSGVAESSTINVTTKINSTSGLPSEGYYLIPVVPGTFTDLKITAQYSQTPAGVQYADYTAEYSSSNTLVRGKFKSIELSGPFVTSVTSGTPSLDGTTLSLKGSTEIYLGGKVTAENYAFSFKYREKDSETEWTKVDALYSEGKLSASATVATGKVYEVKACVEALNAVKNGDTLENQLVEGDVNYLSSSVTYVIDSFGTAEYNGMVEDNCWKCTDGKAFPSKSDGNGKKTFTFDYYKIGTDTTPYLSGIVLYSNSTNNISFSGNKVLLYTGYVKFPGIAGKRVTNVTLSIISSSQTGEMKVSSFDGSKDYGSNSSYVTKTDMDLSVDLTGDANDGVKVSVRTWNIGGMKITYSAI